MPVPGSWGTASTDRFHLAPPTRRRCRLLGSHPPVQPRPHETAAHQTAHGASRQSGAHPLQSWNKSNTLERHMWRIYPGFGVLPTRLTPGPFKVTTRCRDWRTRLGISPGHDTGAVGLRVGDRGGARLRIPPPPRKGSHHASLLRTQQPPLRRRLLRGRRGARAPGSRRGRLCSGGQTPGRCRARRRASPADLSSAACRTPRLLRASCAGTRRSRLALAGRPPSRRISAPTAHSPRRPSRAGDTSEDCLYLNVSTPSVKTPARKRPVLVGSTAAASLGAGRDYDPAKLAAAGTVVSRSTTASARWASSHTRRWPSTRWRPPATTG